MTMDFAVIWKNSNFRFYVALQCQVLENDASTREYIANHTDRQQLWSPGDETIDSNHVEGACIRQSLGKLFTLACMETFTLILCKSTCYKQLTHSLGPSLLSRSHSMHYVWLTWWLKSDEFTLDQVWLTTLMKMLSRCN